MFTAKQVETLVAWFMMMSEGGRAVSGFQRDLVGKINKTWSLNVGGVGWRSGEEGWEQKSLKQTNLQVGSPV